MGDRHEVGYMRYVRMLAHGKRQRGSVVKQKPKEEYFGGGSYGSNNFSKRVPFEPVAGVIFMCYGGSVSM